MVNNQNVDQNPQKLKRIVAWFGIFLSLLILFIQQVVPLFLFPFIFHEIPTENKLIIFNIIWNTFCFVGLGYGLGYLIFGLNANMVDLDQIKPKHSKWVVIAFFYGLIGHILILILLTILGNVLGFTEYEIQYGEITTQTLLRFIFSIIVAPITEEIFFRGVLYEFVNQGLGFIFGAVIGPSIVLLLMVWLGFNEQLGADQSEQTALNMRYLFAALNLFSALMALIFIKFVYNIGPETVEQMEKDLGRDVEVAAD